MPEVAGILGFGIDADGAAGLLRLALGQIDHFLERGDLEPAVEFLWTLRIGRDRTQGLDFGEREVVREPTRLRLAIHFRRALARGELRVHGHIGADPEVRVVARNEHAILRGDQVEFDEIGTEFDRLDIGLDRLFRQVARSAAVCGHQRRIAVQRLQRRAR